MMVAALLGIWLWKAGVIKQIWGIPIKWLVGIAGNSCLGKIYRRGFAGSGIFICSRRRFLFCCWF